MAALPEFDRPPVVETVLAIEFAPVNGWNLAHFGALWAECYRAEYPVVRVTPSIATSLHEDVTTPPVRFFFSDSEDSKILQTRIGALAGNWRATKEAPSYPRFRTILPSFRRDLTSFYRFLEETGFELPAIWKCEVTYINQLVQGREWNTFSDLVTVLPSLVPHFRKDILSEPILGQFAYNFQLPDEQGSFLITLTPQLNAEGRQFVQLTLSAISQPNSNEIEEIVHRMQVGHDAVVRTFAEITSHDVQIEHWRRTC